jgi:hypothetical protein
VTRAAERSAFGHAGRRVDCDHTRTLELGRD